MDDVDAYNKAMMDINIVIWENAVLMPDFSFKEVKWIVTDEDYFSHKLSVRILFELREYGKN